MDILAQDPRPSYQQDAERVYGMEYAGNGNPVYCEQRFAYGFGDYQENAG